MKHLLLIVAFAGAAHATSMVQPTVLEIQRISGERNIQPDEVTRAAIAKAGKQVIGVFKLCIDTKGKVSSIDRIKSTGFAAYDAELRGGMNLWKYKPRVVNGKPIAICGTITFLFTPVVKKTA